MFLYDLTQDLSHHDYLKAIERFDYLWAQSPSTLVSNEMAVLIRLIGAHESKCDNCAETYSPRS